VLSQYKKHCEKHQFLILFVIFFAIIMAGIVASTYWVSQEPTAYWKFNQEGIQNITEESGLLNLTINSSLGSYVTGKLNNALNMSAGHDSTNGYIAINSTRVENDFTFGTGDFTVVFWFNSITGLNSVFLDYFNGATGWQVRKDTDNDGITFLTDNSAYGTTVSVADDLWHRVVFVREGTGVDEFRTYVDNNNTVNDTMNFDISKVDGHFKLSNPTAGQPTIYIDDLQIYKGYAWTVDDVNVDYGGGNGREGDDSSPSIILIDPANNDFHMALDILFNATATPISNYSLVNSTLMVWHSNGTLFNQKIDWFNGTELNYSFITLYDIPADKYEWNKFVCSSNETNSACGFQQSNFTVTRGFDINEEIFNATATTTSSQSYSLNINYSDTEFPLVTGSLIYNEIPYTATITGTGNDTIFSVVSDAPIINSQETLNFYWSLSFASATTTILNTTAQSQIINEINGSAITNPYKVSFLNFTIYDEDTLLPLNVTFLGTFNFGINSLSNNFTFSETAQNSSNYEFALNPPDESYNIVGTIENEATHYLTELYTLEEQVVTNSSTAKSIYLLNSSRSTSFVVHVRDTSYSDISDANVFVQRFYPGTNEWLTVESLITNIEGKAIGHFVTEEVNYRFQVYTNGELKLISTPTKIFCEESPCTITLTIASDPGDGFSPFSNLSQFTSTLDFSKTTEIFTYTYTDTSNEAQGGRLRVLRTNYGIASPVTICDTVSADSSAVITCDISLEINGTYIATAYNNRTSDENKVVHRIVHQKTRDIITEISGDGLLWSAFLLITVVMLGLFSPALAIIFGIVGVLVVWKLELASIPILSLVAIVIIGVIILGEIKSR